MHNKEAPPMTFTNCIQAKLHEHKRQAAGDSYKIINATVDIVANVAEQHI